MRAAAVLLLLAFLSLQSALADSNTRCCEEPCDVLALCTVTCAACLIGSTVPAKARVDASSTAQGVVATVMTLHDPLLLAEIWRPPRGHALNGVLFNFHSEKP